MKTTSATALNKRIEKLIASKELRKTSLVYGWVNDLKSNDTLRPVFSQGSSWNSSSLVDKTIELTTVLRKLGIEFSTGNDAPKGGKTGYFVKINTKIK